MNVVPSLNLRDDCLSSPQRIDLATIESLMFWPNEIERREKYCAAVTVDALKGKIDFLSTPLLREFAAVAAETPQLSTLKPDDLRWRNGMAAGLVLQYVVKKADDGKIANASLGNAYAFVSRVMKPKFRMDTGHVRDAAWRDFKSVAHLWAAAGNLELAAMKAGRRPVFPCRIDELASFLDQAAYFRQRGSEIVPVRGSHSVLPLSESVEISKRHRTAGEFSTIQGVSTTQH